MLVNKYVTYMLCHDGNETDDMIFPPRSSTWKNSKLNYNCMISIYLNHETRNIAGTKLKLPHLLAYRSNALDNSYMLIK